MFKFRVGYFAICLSILLIEIFIATCVHDRWLRPYGGDTLAVVLVYTALRSVLRGSVCRSWWTALTGACLVELSQLGDLAVRLGLGQHKLALTLLGTSFDPGDFLAYGVGATAILLFEHVRTPPRHAPHGGERSRAALHLCTPSH